MIALFSDFSVDDPYVGLMKLVIYQRAPHCKLVDVCHNLPKFNPNASGRLLQMLVGDVPAGAIVLAVVDPGVGTDRHPLWLDIDGRHFIGPDNGLFARLVNAGKDINAHIIDYDAENVSASFHGRDVFAPAAAQIETGNHPASCSMDVTTMIGKPWPAELNEIIYIDHYGNAMSGIDDSQITENLVFKVKGVTFRYRKTFESSAQAAPFWYVNSIGLVEFAQYRASIAALHHLKIGDSVSLVSS